VRVDVDGLQPQRLPARKGEQLSRQARAAVDGLLHRFHRLGAAVLVFVEHAQAAADDHQQIVEIMRHAAGELADGFHLAALQQRFLGVPALFDFSVQRVRL
jgi:hypothetical protein